MVVAASDSPAFECGSRNLITDVAGLRVGNAADAVLKSGVTVLVAEQPFVCSVDVMGGAPGTRETDMLEPHCMVPAVDALVLSGGSAFGLDAASGVANELSNMGRGFAVGPARVPLVPAAILFDLLNGGNKAWTSNPYAELGREALLGAKDDFALGSVGAGCGATTATHKGGLGSASLVLQSGSTVAALVAANPVGSATVPGTPHFWAAPYELNNEFGGRGFAHSVNPLQMPPPKYASVDDAGIAANTTLAIVATDAALNKSQLKRLAVAAQDGMARALFPSHTPFDGDLVFALSTVTDDIASESAEVGNEQQLLLGHAASLCVTRAIARGVYEASAHENDLLPSWQQRWNQIQDS